MSTIESLDKMKRFVTASALAFGLAIGFFGNANAQSVTAPNPQPVVAPNPQPAVAPAVPAAEQPLVPKGGIFQFEEETHDFGELIQGGDASTTFRFKNVGTDPITIRLARGSCGCTVPTWPQEPIAPGETGEIFVKYDSNRIGIISKNVTIISDAAAGEKIIYIKGNISPKPQEAPAPGSNPTVPAGGH